MKIYAWLSGAWTALLWFFTFGVAWNLFRLFPREQAGQITTALFPTYFTAGVVLGCAATASLAALWRHGLRVKIALCLQLAAAGFLAGIALFIQPAMAAYGPGTPGFARLHGISMAMNLLSLLAVPAASIVVLARRKE